MQFPVHCRVPEPAVDQVEGYLGILVPVSSPENGHRWEDRCPALPR